MLGYWNDDILVVNNDGMIGQLTLLMWRLQFTSDSRIYYVLWCLLIWWWSVYFMVKSSTQRNQTSRIRLAFCGAFVQNRPLTAFVKVRIGNSFVRSYMWALKKVRCSERLLRDRRRFSLWILCRVFHLWFS